MRSPLRLETRALASSSCTMVQHFTWSLTVQGRCRMRLARSLQDPVIAWPKAFRNRYDGLAERVLHRRWLRAPDPGRHLFHLSGNVGARAKATVSSYLWKSRFDATHLRTGSRNCVFSRRCNARQFSKGVVAHTGVSSPQQLRRASGQKRSLILMAERSA